MPQAMVSKSSSAIVLLSLLACSRDPSADPAAPGSWSGTEQALVVEATSARSSANSPPRLVLKTTPALDMSSTPPTLSGVAPLAVHLNLCNSDDPDATDSLNWQFHFGDSGRPAFNADGTFNPDFDHFCRVDHSYAEGMWTATLSVTDKHLEDQGRGGGVTAKARTTTTIQIVATSSSPPEPPAPGPGSAPSEVAALSIVVGANPLGPSVNTQTLGWDFTTTVPVTITRLGLFDAGSDGLAQAQQIGVWTIAGALVVDGTVGPGTGNPLVGPFRYVQVPEVVIPPGTYVIGAQYVAFSADQLPTTAASVTSDARILFSGPRFGLGAGFPFPNTDQGPGNNHFGPNFQFRPQ